ncbi:MutS domain V [Geosporobacter subterraneus DSM 17957]|uniref:MutS domain V n=1 Tax=Geosporobacter subterraneus DSM 17957 TaxID=1121919 RepID=A0A1M6LJW5_9FIRM|nr:DNA mismatch repair protein MutS [Geosporobacter subterraneus]SHJ71462.1 MutS domain V [Geosporobacter subterraneus DSM 17957]
MITEKIEKNLDLDYIFDRITVYTPYGEARKKEMKPFRIGEECLLEEEFNRIEKVIDLLEKHRYTFVEIRNQFKNMKDLRGSFKRIEEDGVLSVVELFEIKVFLGILEKLHDLLEKLPWNMPKELEVQPLYHLQQLLDPQQSGVNTFYIYDEYSEALRDIREKIRGLENTINQAKMQARDKVQSELGFKIRPNGEITINKGNREMVETAAACEGLVYSAETYMNITYRVKMDERFDRLFQQIEDLKLEEEEEEFRIRERLTKEMKGDLSRIYDNIYGIGALDLLIAKAYFAVGFHGVKPALSGDNILRIEEGRHIKVEDTLRRQGKAFTPITVDLKKGVTCITGANMGGKTISLKLIGQLSAMAQFGIFVPAKGMTFSLKEYIFLSLGDLQSTDMGLSTFGAEIVEIKKILNRAKEKGLILIDELARGTNPSEGYALSKAIIEYLQDKDAITVITTHIDGLAEGPVCHLQVRGLRDVNFEQLKEQWAQQEAGGIEMVHQHMDYRLEVVHHRSKVPRDAINIARLMGLDEEILEKAEQYLDR